MHIDSRVIFVHNPRAAGTSIRRALVHGENPHLSVSWPGNLKSSVSRNRKHGLASYVKAKLPPRIWDRRFKFSVVRNPHDRLVSLYGLFRRPMEERYQAEGGPTKRGDPRWKLDKLIASLHRDGMDQRLLKLQKLKLLRMAFGLGFKDWLKFCDEYCWNAIAYIEESRAGLPRPLTCIPQVEWFDGLDRVFKFEELDELYDVLVGMGYPVPVVENQTEREPWESYYDAETFDRVAATFHEDIRRFGY